MWLHPNVKAEVDSGCAGLARDLPGQAGAPPWKPAADAGPFERNFHDHARCRRSQRRIAVEHANAEAEEWRSLQRRTGIPEPDRQASTSQALSCGCS
ncbi:hypothetical protein GCM10018781_28440 [Kitasatospora indigofera]|uniref:Uncharacterized protein n=1 Tax=Kitasatospora indigofera TaxID=67307 RepID=A0A919KRQ4_9ACTN|nr:hypothetical protein GCM10018781_28440 [Kitasatospora indigofera]